MNTKGLTKLFIETTNLKPGQAKALTSVIIEYDDPEELAYEAIGLLSEGIKYSKIKEDFIAGRFGWAGVMYNEQRNTRALRDNILAKPPEVREGEIECPKCHQKKTLVVEMQTRSADEGFTYSIHCFNPKCKAITK